MTEYVPVTTVEEYRLLDEAEILEGYLDGVSNGPEPGSRRSRAYWHGWLNGCVDAGRSSPTPAQQQLEAAFEALRHAALH